MGYCIVSLDGGGIRGALSAALLSAIQRRQAFLEHVDLFAGTSTGGILALGLAQGLAPEKLVQLYSRRGGEIFGRRDFLDTILGDTDEIYRAKYGTDQLKRVLLEELGDGKLAQLRKKVLVSSFDLESGSTGQWKPKFFHNYAGKGSDGDETIVDVALRTSAAPTYFPSYQGYVDGGVVANNPAACALAKAVKSGQHLQDIRLLSVGTGFNPHRIAGESHDWGTAQWLSRILELVMEGSLDVPHYQCQQLLEHRYHRLQVKLPEPMKLDAIDRVPELLALAETPAVLAQIDAAVSFIQGRFLADG